MNIQHIDDQLSEYIDGSLPAAERAAIEAHLRSCEKCRKELDSLRQLVNSLHELPKHAPLPENFLSTLDTQLRAVSKTGDQFTHRNNGKEGTMMNETAWMYPARLAVSRGWIMRIAATFAVLVAAGIVWFIVKNSGVGIPMMADRVDIPSKPQSIDGSRTVERDKAQAAKTPGHSKDRFKEKKSTTILSSPTDSMRSEALASNTNSAAVHPNESSDFSANVEQAPQNVSAPAIEEPRGYAKAAAPLLNESVVRTGTISGRVTDKATGDSLAGVNIIITGTMRGAVTDVLGHYTILNVPIGECAVSARLVGYANVEQTGVKVEEGKTTTLDFRLLSTAVEIQSVTIAGDAQLIASPSTNAAKTVTSDVINLPQSHATIGGGRAKEKQGYLSRADATHTYFHTEEYGRIYENEFLDALKNPLSTFSIDVDAASYSNIRRFISNGQLPPKDAVRIEEMINYFTYDYPQPRDEHPFSITTDVAACPWNEDHQLVLIGLQGRKIATEDLSPSNLVFLIDVSGSMAEPNKLPLVQAAFRLLVNQLRSNDRVSIVVYAGNAGLVLPSTRGSEKQTILDAIDRLEAGGSTAGGAGIQLAYKVAEENFLQEGNNRVILATDGDFNVGISSTGELVRFIEGKRDEGISLSVLGFGTDNYKDDRMEQLADKGNGNHFYIDNIQEARKVFIGQMAGTLFTIAKDVKLQIEFNPTKVKAYRLIGYENRMLKKEDFNDDKKDAGELGAGHTVTALYEIVPADGDVDLPSVDPLKYQNTRVGRDRQAMRELLTVKFRYKEPTGSRSKLLVRTLESNSTSMAHASSNLRFAAAVAEFGMLLRDSEFKNHASLDQVLELAHNSGEEDPEGYRAEFTRMVESCKLLRK